MIKTVAKKMPSPRWVDVLKNEKRLLKVACLSTVEQLSLQCMREDSTTANRAIQNLCDDLSYTITAMVAVRVAQVMNYSKSERQAMWSAHRPKQRAEQVEGDKQWKKRTLRTYLIIKGLLPPDLI
tara:strand:- start:31981 stop:32355 length:375 start_codon:yes stop_codon:yes gene_type:complete